MSGAWNNLPSDVVNEYESLFLEKFNNHFEALDTSGKWPLIISLRYLKSLMTLV